MFKLQRLEITGFKSFADYTEIIFTGDGITAIVGPNGCGKSNVADAIAWVLGEQRVKHLRGGEMKDVIFQGARNRQPSGMAEVVMHMVRDEVLESEPDIEDIDSTLERIDDRLVNLDAVLPQETQAEATAEAVIEVTPSETEPVEVAATPETTSQPKIPHKRHWRRRNLALEFAPGEAVSVTRRLYRSGESEYLLNGKICRLRDIQDLFSGTGLAGGHYAIIEQGRIGQILSAKPMDRRTIIEEAAGITKFRVRQRATEARLDSARSNLSRISDIVAEIDRQVNSLRRQAAKARRYGVLREELRELLRHVYVAEDRKLATLLEETNARLAEITELELGIADDLGKREDAARAATQEARSLEDELTSARAAAAEAVLRRDRQARECVYQQEQLSEIEKRKGEVTAEIEALTSRLVLIETECRRLQQEDAKLREEADQSALLLRTAEDSYAQRLASANSAEVEIESARAELLSQTAIAERVREIARQLEATLERLSQQAEGLAREGDRAASQHAERRLEAERFSRELGDARARVAKLQAERETAVDAVVRGHEAVSDIEAELTRVRDEHSRASHRLESLKELDQRRAYYSPAVQLIFSTSETPRDFHFIGTLADALNVDAKWERAVEGVLGSSLQSIVVPTPADAVRAAQWLRENNGGRASFLVAGLHGGSDEVETEPVTALACRLEERPSLSLSLIDGIREDLRICDLLGAPQQLVTVLKRTLPQKVNARIAANLDDAMVKSIATGEMYVTLNGDWIASGQFVNAGDARDLEEGAGLLAFKRELRELETRAETLAHEVDAAARSAKETRARLVELEDAVVLLNEAIGREERDALAREHTTTNLQQEVERAERHMRVVGQDSARVDEEKLEVESRKAQALLEAEAAEQAREAAADRVIKASALLTDLRREAEIESESLAGQRAAAAAAAERRRATTAELRRSEGELADFAARVDRYRMDLAEMAGRSEELKLSIADLELAASTVESDRAREEEQIADLSNRLQDARRQADEFSAELSELNRKAAEVRDARGTLEVQRAEAHARQTFVHENCQTELGQSLEDLARELTFPEDFDLEISHARVEELRTKLEGFGGVNMMALEELAEAEERLLFLTVQRQDIIEGISATEEALREIKRRSRERFRHAFEQINKNFSALFQELFGGGRGEMNLIDADDVLESGIDVVAQPPGKRLQNVLLLSGGEKAMAALALVLGIFHYRPAPFCLLDEVDAPLDEANVGRFTDKVVQMSENTQFIVITHNKRTMEMARALYGVTMEEAGVSKLVSVKFE
ncbi:MAG TPA: chromosome segregation protein SMC [Pyrinomonadaceae bacterium]